MERTWDVTDTLFFSRVEYVHVTDSKDANGNESLVVQEKAGAQLSSVPFVILELINPYSHLVGGVDGTSSLQPSHALMFTAQYVKVAFETLVTADSAVQLRKYKLIPISINGKDTSFEVKRNYLLYVRFVTRLVSDLMCLSVLVVKLNGISLSTRPTRLLQHQLIK